MQRTGLNRQTGWRACLVICLAVSTAACTFEDVKRFAFEQGDQYRCRQESRHRPDSSMAELNCMGPNRDRTRAFEEYERARAAELETPTDP